MNLQLLDWFVKVARHGGISQAVRRLPHSIQQPTLSEHMAELEAEIGAPLFIRHPFRLLEAGRELLELAQPFFEELNVLVARLRDRRQQLRLAPSELIRPATVAGLVHALQLAHPGLHCVVLSTSWPELGSQLQMGTIDVAIAPRSAAEPGRLSCRVICQLPLVLLVPNRSPLRDPEQLWSQQPIAEPLIAPPAVHVAAQVFVRGLRQAGLRWDPAIEVDSLTRVPELVAAGAGVGLSVMAPWLVQKAGIRVLPLAGFEPVQVGVFWRNPGGSMVRNVVELTEDLDSPGLSCTIV